jgi:hypothetical protein
MARSRTAGSGIEVKDGVLIEERIPGEVHLRHEPLRESAANSERRGCAEAATHSGGSFRDNPDSMVMNETESTSAARPDR